MSKKSTVKSAAKSPKSMTEAVKAIRVESGIKAGSKPGTFTKTLSTNLAGG
jgi:hypothetical protein